MSYKKLNFISEIYFYLILLSGLFYGLFLIIASKKILPAFIMQILFLFDVLKFNNNIAGLFFSKMFLLNVTSGIFLFGLVFKYIKTIFKSIESVESVNNFKGSLKIIERKTTICRFKEKKCLIFTMGFINPEIFISSSIFDVYSQKEIEAMIQHEENHKNNHHPLKIFLANFVKSALPYIPGKNWLIDNYLTLIEVTSDKFAENKVNNKLPLISALLKFQKQSFGLDTSGISYFNSQSERIKILIGQKKQTLKQPMVYYSMILTIMLFGSLFLKNSSIFFDCRHILKCIKNLVDPNSQSLIIADRADKNSIILSDHCQ